MKGFSGTEERLRAANTCLTSPIMLLCRRQLKISKNRQLARSGGTDVGVHLGQIHHRESPVENGYCCKNNPCCIALFLSYRLP